MSSRTRDHEYLSDAEFRAWHGALQFTNAAMRAIDESLQREHGLSIKEFDVLITLYNAPQRKLRMTELAEQVVLTPSGVTHLVTRLEKEGLLRRTVDEDDRRSFFTSLTAAGDRRLRDARPTHNEVVRRLLVRRLNARELATLGALWSRVLEL